MHAQIRIATLSLPKEDRRVNMPLLGSPDMTHHVSPPWRFPAGSVHLQSPDHPGVWAGVSAIGVPIVHRSGGVA